VTFPPLPQPVKAGTGFSDPRGMQGWVDLVRCRTVGARRCVKEPIYGSEQWERSVDARVNVLRESGEGDTGVVVVEHVNVRLQYERVTRTRVMRQNCNTQPTTCSPHHNAMKHCVWLWRLRHQITSHQSIRRLSGTLYPCDAPLAHYLLWASVSVCLCVCLSQAGGRGKREEEVYFPQYNQVDIV